VTEPTIALVFTPEAWVEELHRHCTDHGGARVRQVLIEPALALEEQYDVLVVSHRWPALTRGLIDDVHARGARVLGVYDRDEPVGNDLLRAVGADTTVATDGGPAGIVAALRVLHGEGKPDVRAPNPVVDAAAARAPRIVVSGPAGAGASEIAIALAAAVHGAVLVDADDVAPSIAPRLGLDLEPNLRLAVDALEYDGAAPGDHLVALGAGARVLAGLPSAAAWSHVRPPEVLRLAERVAALDGVAAVLVNVAGALEDLPVAMARPRHALARAFAMEADALVAVGDASPVGVVRLLGWIADARSLTPRAPLHVVVNRAPKDGFRRAEVVDEIRQSFGVASVHVVPQDRRVVAAAWNGTLVARGPFTRAVARCAEACTETALRAAS
jgi:hypothetical protein